MKRFLLVFGLVAVITLLLRGFASMAEPTEWTDCLGVKHKFTAVREHGNYLIERYILVQGKLAGFERSVGGPFLKVCIVDSQDAVNSYYTNWVASRYRNPDLLLMRDSPAAASLDSRLQTLRKK